MAVLTPTQRTGVASRGALRGVLELPLHIPTATQALLDQALEALQAHKDEWVRTGITERIALMEEVRRDMLVTADRWIEASLEAKGVQDNRMARGEEWCYLAITYRCMRLLHQALSQVERFGRPRIPGPLTTQANGQVVARVFPQTLYDRMLFMGTTGEVRMEPGMTESEILANQARIYHDGEHAGKVALLLAGGNVGFLPPLDLLHLLFVEDAVVLVKMHPINAYLGPLLEEGCRSLIGRGLVRIVYGGADEGEYLCQHPAVDAIHLTGSDKTLDTIVFGAGAAGVKRKAEHNPLLDKPITAELGNITPIIVVPGPWKPKDLHEQMVYLATALFYSAGCNCGTARMIVTHRQWPQRQALLDTLGQVLQDLRTRKAFYPGAAERHAAFLAAHPEALRFGAAPEGHLPWTLIPGIDPANAEDIAFTTEAFCSLMTETALEAATPAEFLDQAVEFANDRLWGTLCATLLVHPKSLAERKTAAALERAIANLRYGTVTVNLFQGYAYYMATLPWGGFPGSDIYNPQSGIGMVGNVLMFDRPQKGVARAPFHKLVEPFSVQSKRFVEAGRALAMFDANPSPRKFVPVLWHSMLA